MAIHQSERVTSELPDRVETMKYQSTESTDGG